MDRDRRKIFISHAHEDAALSQVIRESMAFLQQSGLRVVCTSQPDADVLVEGSWPYLKSEVESSELVLVMWSDNAMNSRGVTKERHWVDSDRIHYIQLFERVPAISEPHPTERCRFGAPVDPENTAQMQVFFDNLRQLLTLCGVLPVKPFKVGQAKDGPWDVELPDCPWEATGAEGEDLRSNFPTLTRNNAWHVGAWLGERLQRTTPQPAAFEIMPNVSRLPWGWTRVDELDWILDRRFSVRIAWSPRRKGSYASPRKYVSGHHPTVPEGWTQEQPSDPFDGAVEEGRICLLSDAAADFSGDPHLILLPADPPLSAAYAVLKNAQSGVVVPSAVWPQQALQIVELLE